MNFSEETRCKCSVTLLSKSAVTYKGLLPNCFQLKPVGKLSILSLSNLLMNFSFEPSFNVLTEIRLSMDVI